MEEDIKKKIGNIFKVSYQPEFSIGFKGFCKAYVPGMFKVDDVETNQYNIITILDQIEELDYEINNENSKLLYYLIETEKIEYIEL